MQLNRFNSAENISARLRAFAAVILMLCLGAYQTAAEALVPTPRVKPEPPNASQFLTDKDAERFRRGLRAAKKRHWSDLDQQIKKLDDNVAKDTLRWVRAARNPNVSFKDISYVVQDLNDWPRMTAIQAKAEAILFDDPISARKTIEWFQKTEPVAGEGRVALARAYYRTGNRETADLWLKSAWRESKLTRKRQQTVFKQFRGKLSKEDHAVRADHLIWQGRRHHAKAEALLPHMGKKQRALMNARIRTASNRSGMDAAIRSVPQEYRDEAGLLYERAKWRRRKKTKDYALPVYLQIVNPPLNPKGREVIWKEKRIMLRWAIEKKKYQEAYQLSTNHGMTRGAGFAEAEFTAGWLALTKLGEPRKAAQHFETLKNGVSLSVSLSRAAYWQARAAEALSDPNARVYYAEASAYTNTYYGQLAAEKIGGRLATVNLPMEADTSDIKLAFEADPRIRAMHLLGEVGEERFFTQFAFHLDDVLNAKRELSLLSQLSKNYGYMRPSLRAAKQASRFQSMLTDSGYPIIEEIESLPSKFDIPFVYAIARQESEFEFNVVSSAKAYGMMQMINSTAKYTARKHRIPYSVSKLTADRDYSAKLGALHIHDLLDMFDGSYILAAAAYNAGPHRSKTWIKTYGDPRTGDIDPIDWVESIPFSETRNYVQRVMENMQVYRARRNGNQSQNLIYQDLTQGAF
ncbi:lytic transglycosylase domain-containing protein [Hellea balneolensis]|uniref:lytic transglycosylase domain-containing protein n=1 Tax=Hellea balneolensis TaxID=287478 RepID=UPI000428DF48|nr:lytic transglycosylase domain-containing protein [Hellea balneolensis]